MLPVDLEKYKHKIVYKDLKKLVKIMMKNWKSVRDALENLDRRIQVLESAGHEDHTSQPREPYELKTIHTDVVCNDLNLSDIERRCAVAERAVKPLYSL